MKIESVWPGGLVDLPEFALAGEEVVQPPPEDRLEPEKKGEPKKNGQRWHCGRSRNRRWRQQLWVSEYLERVQREKPDAGG